MNRKSLLRVLFILIILYNNGLLLANVISEKSLFINKTGSVWVETAATTITTSISVSTTSVCKNASSPIVTIGAQGGTAPYTFTYKIDNGSEITRTTTGTNNTININASTSITGVFKYTLVSVASNNGIAEPQTAKDVTITVNEPPTVDFSFADNQCSGTSILFTPTVTGAVPFKYEWTFGSGSTATIATTEKPLKTFSSYGCATETFPIKLVVTDNNGCSTTKSKSITIKQQPAIDFYDVKSEFDPFNNCSKATNMYEEYTITVGNRSTSECISSYSINWGDGNSENNIIFPITHTYLKLGVFNMSISAVGTNGCNSTKTFIVKNVTDASGSLISPKGTANLCAPTEELQFKLATWGTNSPGTKYTIDYGDGTPLITYTQEELVNSEYYDSAKPDSSVFPIPHSYKKSSCTQLSREFILVLTVSNPCQSKPKTFTVDNIVVLEKPQADFTLPQNVCINSSATFKNITEKGYTINCDQTATYKWDFGDGTPVLTLLNSSPTDVSHTYTKSGTYTITLTAEAYCGSSSKTKQICVETPLTPAFSLDKTEGCIPLTVNTTNTTNEETACKSAVSYLWDITYTAGYCGTTKSYTITTSSGTVSNGTSTLKNPVINFINSGTYKIQLTATNRCGSQTTTVQTVAVKAPPTISINTINNSCETSGGTIISPVGTVTNCGTENLAYEWSFPGGTPASSTSETPGTITYSTAGTYKVTLKVTNECSSVSAEKSFTINPIPVISGNLQACVGKTEQLKGDGTAAITTPWISSNATVATITSAGLVTAKSAGTTTITYINSLGCKATILFTVNEIPTISGTLNVCIGNTRKLTGSGTQATSNPWTSLNPSIAAVNDTGLVKGVSVGTTTITYTNSNGCQFSTTFTVNALPVISGNLNGCVGLNVQLSGTGTPSPTSPWTSSDVNIATISNTGMVTGKAIGTTIITYTNTSGCQDTAKYSVNEPPTLNKPNDQIVCNGSKTSDVIFSGSIANATYKWTIDKAGIGISSSGSGNISSFTAINSGSTSIVATFTVTATVNGCDGNPVQFNITILPSPVISTQPLSASVCLNGASPILNVSYSNSTETPEYQWYSNSINNNTTGTLISGENKSTYSPSTNTVGTIYYYCVLNFKNSGGCDSITSNAAAVVVNPLPTITKQPLDSQSICVGGSVSAYIVEYTGGTSNATYQWYKNTINANTGGVSISGATNASYTPPVSDFTNAGTVYYYVIVSLNGSGCGSVTSNVAKVVVVPDPVVDTQPLASQTVCQSTNPANLTVVASGGVGNFLYQWYSNTTNSNSGGSLIQGATSDSYVPPTDVIGTKYYYCVISQSSLGCQVTSSVAAVTVVSFSSIINQPVSSDVCLNGIPTNLTVAYTNGTGTPVYQWYSNTTNSNLNGTLIQNANTNTYSPPANAVGTIYYYCKITFSQGGCSEITSSAAQITVNPLPTITKQPLDSQSICVGGSVSAYIVEYTEGTGNATYQWYKNTVNANTGGVSISGATNASYTPPASDFTNAGTVYYYVIVSLNGSGCGSVTSDVAKVVVVPDPVVDTQPLASQTVCQSTNPANLTVVASGGVGNFLYQWYSNTTNSNSGGFLIQGATSDSYIPPTDVTGLKYYYCVISQSSLGCQVTSSVAAVTVVSSPSIINQPVSSDVCKGEIPSLLSVSYKDGVGTPQYQWYSNLIENKTTGTIISGANNKDYQPIANKEGTMYYYCKITFPSGGCSSIISEIAKVTVYQYPVISDFYIEIGSGKSFSIIPVNNATDTVPTGTVYTWTQPIINPLNSISGASAQSVSQTLISQTLTNNTKNKATVVYDVKPISGNCQGKNFKITIVVNPPIFVQSKVSDLKCFGSNDGEINISVEGGNPPYVIQWAGPDNFTSDKYLMSNLKPGNYALKIIDNGGITYSGTFTINEPKPLELKTTDVKGVSCNGSNNGMIKLDITGGAGKYNYKWTKNGIDFSTSKDIIDIGPGQYNVSVTDTNNCGPVTQTYNISEPEVLKISLNEKVDNKCYGDALGKIKVSVTGGSLIEVSPGKYDYKYQWKGANGFTSTSKDIENLYAGEYTLSVTDNSGCSSEFKATISQTDEIKIDTIVTPISCYGADDASIKLNISGGVPPYTAEWDNFASGFYQQNLSAKDYIITVTDANQCNKQIKVTIPEAPLFKITTNVKQISCYGANDGSIKLKVEGGVGKVMLKWSDNSTSGTERNNIGPGTYNVVISDETSCSHNYSFIIKEPEELVISSKITDAFECENTMSGAIDLTISGGTPPYKYLWSDLSTKKDLKGITLGIYFVTVTDSAGCSATSQFKVKRQSPITITAETKPYFDCLNHTISVICTAKPVGGVPPYTIVWSDGKVSSSNNEIMETNKTGVVVVKVTDAMGCSNSYSFMTEIPNAGINCVAYDCNNQIYSFDFITTGNLFTETSYIWDFGDGNGSTQKNTLHTYLKPGEYTVKATIKSNECNTTFEKVVNIDSIPVLRLNRAPKLCKNDSVTVKASGAYTYSWNDGTKTDSLVIKTAGDYYVIGTTSNGCTSQLAFTATYFDNYNYQIYTDKNYVTPELPDIKFWTEDIYLSKYFWDFGDGESDSGNNIIHNYFVNNDGFYNVILKVLNPDGCTETATKKIYYSIDKLPNIFTPNGDGFNDVFLAGSNIQVYNSNGVLLYEGVNGWDGTYKGKPVANDTYYYVKITYKEKGVEYKADYVTVVR